MSVIFGPVGLALGVVTGLGFLGYQLLKDSNNKKLFLIEHVGPVEASTHTKTNNDAQAPGKPTKEDGFVPPKRWDGKKVRHPQTGQYGYPDDKGNVWVPTGPGPLAHGGPHWDVQHPGGKTYDNVYPGGRVRPGK